MAQAARLRLRMQKELKLLLADPPYGASFPFLSPQSDISDLSSIDAQIKGPEGTVYANGIFKIKIQIPERYPLQPPIVTFGTPVYHPNIDTGGRICLDILNLPPKGAWQPSLNISTVLMSIGLLLSEPNPDDGLMCEASREYKYNRQAFEHKARSMTEKYAKAGAGESSCSNQCNTNSMMEVQEGLDIETKIGAKEFVPGQKKPHGISQKLSLESTSSNKEKDSDEEINEMPNHHSLPSDVGSQLEGKRKREKENDVLNEFNPNKEKLDGNRQKSSLKLSNKFKDDFDNKENVDPNYSSLCQRQASTRSNKKKYSGQEVHEMPNHHSFPSDVGNQLEGKREREEEHDVLNEFNLNKEKLDGNKQKSSLKLSNKFKDDFDNKENIDPNYSSLNQHQASSGSSLLQAQQLDRHQDGKSAKSSIKRSSKLCQSQKLPFGSLQTSINAKMHQTPPEEFADGIENVSANITSDKKPGLVGKKLSLGLKGSSLGQLASNKEKVISIDKLPLLKPPGERLLGPKLPLGPSSQVQQDCRPHQKLQSNQVQSMETIVEIKQKGVEETEESLITETIVVLDSEDSEGEEPCSSRSRMPLVARKRFGNGELNLKI